MDTNKINEMIEAVEVLKDAQIELDQVIEKIRSAVQYTPEESTADAYTLPGLMMIAHEEGHGYLGRESGNLDSLMRDLNEIIEEQVALKEEEDTPAVMIPPMLYESIEKGDLTEVQGKMVTQGAHYREDPKLEEFNETMQPDQGEVVCSVCGIVNEPNHPRCPGSIDESKQVKIHDQPDRVRDVLTQLTNEELTVLRVACRPFDGHPGVDSGTIVFYKPEFLAVALISSVEDHVKALDGDGSKGMTSKGLTITMGILEKFEKSGFPGVTMSDLANVNMERDDEKSREVFKADRAVIEGGAR